MELGILHWNCRSIRNKLFSLDNHYFSNSDLICLQEIFLRNEDTFKLKNKIVYRNDRISASRGGGTLIAVNKNISSFNINLNLSPSNIECQAIKIFVKGKWIIIVNIYSPHGNFSRTWLENLFNNLNSPFFIVGDFNIKHRALGAENNSSHSNIFLDWILEHDLNIINTSTPTHLNLNKNELLDLSICSSDMYLNTSYQVIPDPFDSDHFPVLIKIKNFKDNSLRIKNIINWENVNLGIFGSHFSVENLEVECNNVIKENTKKIKCKENNFCPWWDGKCSLLLGKKRKLLRQAKNQVSISLWIEYKKAASTLRKYIKEKKSSIGIESAKKREEPKIFLK